MSRLLSAVFFLVLAAPSQDAALVTLLAPQMMAVSKLVIAERWDSRLDELVQRAPAAAALGDKWTRSAPAWQQARKALGARVTRIIDAYVANGELNRVLQERLAKDFQAAELSQLSDTLKGLAGPAILRQEAQTTFVVEAKETTPESPKAGDPAWFADLRELSKRFTERAGPPIPPEDRQHEAEAAAFARDGVGRKFALLWMSVVSKAETSVTGAINLMLFDDRAAIARDIAQAVATVKSGSR